MNRFIYIGSALLNSAFSTAHVDIGALHYEYIYCSEIAFVIKTI